MPPKTTSDGESNTNSTKTFSFDDVAYLVAKLEASKVSLGQKDYKAMSQLNGTRSEHGYNHLFRAVKARGKEIVPMITGDDANGTSAKSPAAGKGKSSGDGEKKEAKRGRKARSDASPENDDEDGGKKRVKTEHAESEREREVPAADDDFH